MKHTQFYDYCNSNVDNFVSSLQDEINDKEINDFSTFIDIFNDNLDKTCKLDVPKTTKRTIQNNPWITSGIIAAVNQCDKLYDAWAKYRKKKCKDGETDNRGGTCLCIICNDKRYHYTLYKEYRKTLKKVRKDAKAKFYTGKFNEKSGNMKKTWEIINSLRGKGKRQIKPKFIIDNEKIINRRVIANEFNKYFVSLATNLNKAYNELGELSIDNLPSFTDYLPRTNLSSIYFSDCTPEEIQKIISEFQKGKSSDIPIHVVKKSSLTICPLLSMLYNQCIDTGTFPDELKIGKISPIYKKDNEELLENYRPVSTLAIFGKIFEKIIYSRLYSFINSQNILYENQYGFRKQHSTNHAINYSVTHVQKLIREKNHVLGIFIDLSKAFDTISHEKLLYKLDKYGIRGNAHSLIGSYLSNRKQYVSVLGESSDELPVVFGVPQGSVLGPLLFIIYINDIYNSTSVGKFVLFADDTNIFVADKCKLKVFEKANRILESINSYMRCNLLHINIKKCCYMHFTPKQKDIVVDDDNAINIVLGQNKIKLVREIKFLGVIIDDKLSWKPHTKYLSQVTENLETLFVTISGDNPTTIGTLYRPPNGNLEKALDELSSILDIASKQTHIAGDFNIDLHGTNSKCIQDYENVIFSKGFFPTISTITHEKPGCKPSCIDNFITNDIESVIVSGTIPNSISHHFQIFQIFESVVNKSSNKVKR